MKIAYTTQDFGAKSLATIQQADAICREYAATGYDLTLRQLYYQFVARGFIPNRDTEYKRLGKIVNDARLAGLLDWSHLVDRSWELDALDPTTLHDLIRDTILGIMDEVDYAPTWNEKLEDQRKRRADIVAVARQWPAIVEQYGGE